MKKPATAAFIGICTVPTFVVFFVFSLNPILGAFRESLYRTSGLSADRRTFVGIDNFVRIAHDPYILPSLLHNLLLMALVPSVTLLLSLFFAVLLTRKDIRERDLYRIVYFFPGIISTVVIAILWSFIYHPTLGILNALLKAAGLADLALAWLGDSRTALLAVSATNIWASVGFYMVLYIAAIENIPVELFEAAAIDGADRVKQFVRITLPLIWQVVRVSIVFLISGVLYGSYVLIRLMTNGGPNGASQVMANYMYDQAFAQYNLGYATAIGVVIFFLGLSLSILSNRMTRREASYF